MIMIRSLGAAALLGLWTISLQAQSVTDVPEGTASMFEATFASHKTYVDPSSVDVDVIFTKDKGSWRVPTFWRGGNRWGVRFTPPAPGDYVYRLESTDRTNADLHGPEHKVTIKPYRGSNQLLKRGAFKVSQNGRYFVHADGAPFYWLGDTWWTSLSDRLPWPGFQRLTNDRKAKGFTVVMLSVMAPTNEEELPSDPGFCNEGGCVWDDDLRRLNPKYFEYADRRIAYLVEAGIAPVIVGAWAQVLRQVGLEKTKKLWREIIARYGAYPVFWVAGGEVYDPPEEVKKEWANVVRVPGWTEVVRYIRGTDPYRHPLSVHEFPPPIDTAIQDESLTDFDLFQASHFGWASISTGIAMLNMHYARTAVTKPLVLGETGWETFAGQHLEDFQRTAFWTAMLNGAAGFSYGNAITGESYGSDKPLHRSRYSFLEWDEGMGLPSSVQVGLGAKLLQQYPWQLFVPRPDWVTPRGTTLLEPQNKTGEFDIDLVQDFIRGRFPQDALPENELPAGEWRKRSGDFRLPYAAGISNKVRIVYLPSRGFAARKTPTILDLELGAMYRAYYWEPSLGVKVDLGRVQAKSSGNILYRDTVPGVTPTWEDAGKSLLLLKDRRAINVVASVDVRSDSNAGIVLRYKNAENYLVAGYSARQKTLQFLVHRNGNAEMPLGITSVPELKRDVRLITEVRDGVAIISISDGSIAVTSPIVDIPFDWSANDADQGKGVGLVDFGEGQMGAYGTFELRESMKPVTDEQLERRLYDAFGRYRGELTGKHWNTYAREKLVLLNAYRPAPPPFATDWVLVLEAV